MGLAAPLTSFFVKKEVSKKKTESGPLGAPQRLLKGLLRPKQKALAFRAKAFWVGLGPLSN